MIRGRSKKNSLQGKVEELGGLSEPTFYPGIREYPPTVNGPDFINFSGPIFLFANRTGIGLSEMIKHGISASLVYQFIGMSVMRTKIRQARISLKVLSENAILMANVHF